MPQLAGPTNETAFPARRWLGTIALIVLTAGLAGNVVKLVLTGLNAIGYPFELDYGEGIVWQQMDSIVAGRGYAPLQTFPAIVFHYPPVYHLLTALAAALTKIDPLTAGRAISWLSTLGCAGIIARWTWLAMPKTGDRRAMQLGAVLAGAIFIGSPTALTWSSLMRVDMLSTLLTLACLWQTLSAIDRPGRLPLAAVLGALAVYTKQTAIVGPACAFILLWCVRPRLAWTFFAWCGGLALAALAIALATTRGEFLNHVLLYNVNRFAPDRWQLLLSIILSQVICAGIAVAMVVQAWNTLRPTSFSAFRDRLTSDPAARALALGLIYFIARTLMFPMVLKSGASDNYLIDWFSVTAVFVGLGIVAVAAALRNGTNWPSALVFSLVLIGLPLQAVRLTVLYNGVKDTAAEARLSSVAARIAASPRPVISDDMVLLRRAGQQVVYEPAIAAELAHKGRYDEAGFAAMVRRGAFGFFITRGRRGDGMFDERWNPAVADAMDVAYPVTVSVDDLTLHLPAKR